MSEIGSKRPTDESVTPQFEDHLDLVSKGDPAVLRQALEEKAYRVPAFKKMGERYPNWSDFAVRVLQDKETMKELMVPYKKKDKFILFMGLAFVTYLLGYALKKWQHRDDPTISKKFVQWIGRFAFFNIARLAIFIWVFQKEFSPIAEHFKVTMM